VMTYPYYLFLRDQLRPQTTVYFNLDDYRLYWPEKAGEVRGLEERAVRESDVTVCVSRLRAEEVRAAVPEAAGRGPHVPHRGPPPAPARGPRGGGPTGHPCRGRCSATSGRWRTASTGRWSAAWPTPSRAGRSS